MSGISPYLYQNTLVFFKNKSRRKFTPQEDENLKILIEKMGSHNWDKISQFMPGRSAKQCRDRFCNYLSIAHTNEPWDEEEDEVLLRLLSLIGPKWSTISKYIPKRSGNDVKNRWHKHLVKTHSYMLNNICNVLSDTKNDKKMPTIKLEQNNLENNCNGLLDKYAISSLLM